LLRFTSPNLGPASSLGLTAFSVDQREFAIPVVLGQVNSPSRPVAGIGAINQFETTARSKFESLQLQVRGRLRQSFQYQLAYTLSNARDDVSDVFDLAGAFVLPQNSLNLAAEYGPANFDVRHRFSYEFIYDLPRIQKGSRLLQKVINGFALAGMGQFHSGQPFTVNSTIDVNLDGNATDRLNTTQGLVVTGNRQQPLMLTTTNTLSLLAPFGSDGAVGRNTFRAGSVLEIDLGVSRKWKIGGAKSLMLRMDVFNLPNRANFGVPVRLLEAPSFGQATSTITPGRRVQFILKYAF
jgi:hypothetical protein